MAERRHKGLTDPRGVAGDDESRALITRADGYGQGLIDRVSAPPASRMTVVKAGDGESVIVTKAEGDPKSRQIIDPFDNLYTYGGAVIPPLDPYRLLQLAENNAIHGACVTAKAADSVGRGWLWEPEDKNTASEQAPKDLDDLLEKITPTMSFSELLKQAVTEEESVGWSAWEVAREGERDIFTGEEKVTAIFPIPAHTLRATKDENVWVQIKNVEVRYFKAFGSTVPYDALTGAPIGEDALARYMEGGNERRRGSDGRFAGAFQPAREIIVFKTYTPRSPYYGMPTWIGAMPAIAELQAIREFNISFFQSGGTVDRIIHVSADGDEVAEGIADDIMETLKDAAGRGHVTVVTHGNPQTAVNVIPMNGPQGNVGGRDAQFVLRRQDLIKEVLMAHNVPPYRIGLAELGSLGGSAAKEMLRAYKVGSIEAKQNLLQDRLNLSLFGPAGLNVQGYRWKLETLDWDEAELNLSIATQAADRGLISRNEGRDLLGKDRVNDPAMDKMFTASPVAPFTATEEAKTMNDVVAALKAALEAVVRNDPAALAPVPGQQPPGAPGQPPALNPGQKQPPPGPPGQQDVADQAAAKAVDAVMGRIEKMLGMSQIAKGEISGRDLIAIEARTAARESVEQLLLLGNGKMESVAKSGASAMSRAADALTRLVAVQETGEADGAIEAADRLLGAS